MSTQLLKVLVRLMKKEGLVKGARKAKELGFTNKQITNSVNAINKKLAKQNRAPLSRPMRQGTFQSRKNQRKFQNRWDRDEANFFKREKKIAREQKRAENQQLQHLIKKETRRYESGSYLDDADAARLRELAREPKPGSVEEIWEHVGHPLE